MGTAASELEVALLQNAVNLVAELPPTVPCPIGATTAVHPVGGLSPDTTATWVFDVSIRSIPISSA